MQLWKVDKSEVAFYKIHALDKNVLLLAYVSMCPPGKNKARQLVSFKKQCYLWWNLLAKYIYSNTNLIGVWLLSFSNLQAHISIKRLYLLNCIWN